MSGGEQPPAGRHRFTITAQESGQRLDRVLAARLPRLSRAYLQKLIRDRQVTLAADPTAPLKASRTLTTGETLEVAIPPPAPLGMTAEAIPLEILHEDAAILVLNKPAGLVVHPGAGARTGTLVHALLHHCRDLSGIGGVERPGIVHRLDKETSGVMVVAKTDAAHRSLSRQFADREVTKVYHALVWGTVAREEGIVDAAIGRDTRHRLRISTRTGSPREAQTRYVVKERLRGATFLEAHPRTGRTHQIRVHLKLLGHPIVGDALYGGAARGRALPAGHSEAIAAFGRLALHASGIAFTHPVTGKRVRFEAPLPGPFRRLLAAMRG